MDLTQDMLEQVKDLVKPKYNQLNCWAHGWCHVSNVAKFSKKLAEMENQNSLLCEIASYCHDLGRVVEEQDGSITRNFGCQNHAILSIEPTARVLQQVGIKGNDFNFILEAVVAHSYKDYQGNNPVAKILRDADKKDSLGAWAVLRHSSFDFKQNLISPEQIIQNKNNPKKIEFFAEQILDSIKSIPKFREKYKKILDFTLEWYEKKMFHTKSAYELCEKDYQYTKKAREFLEK